MVTYILATIGYIFFLGIVMFALEIKNAPTIDEREPFLWDDYGWHKRI